MAKRKTTNRLFDFHPFGIQKQINDSTQKKVELNKFIKKKKRIEYKINVLRKFYCAIYNQNQPHY